MNTLEVKKSGLARIGFATAILAAIAAAAALAPLAGTAAQTASPIEQVLRDSIGQKKLPGVVAMVANAKRVLFVGAAGERDTAQHLAMTTDTIFRIASMSKPVTSVAVMQLVESGRVKLDEPAATYLPDLAGVLVLEDFDAATKKATMRAPASPPTVRQLLTHTSGFAYDPFDPKLHAYVAAGAVPPMSVGDGGYLKAPLVFDPGTRWEYGISTDWLGRLVEKVSGQTLEQYFQEHIFKPLGMADTSFDVPAEKQGRVAALYLRQPEGNWGEPPQQPLEPARFYSGGGGLYSTADDYMKFARMVLDGGKSGEKRILRAKTVAEMSRNQLGELTLVPLHSQNPMVAKDPIRIPGGLDRFGLGFGINSKPVEGGRSAGSLSWAGIFNTYFWIDPQQKLCAVILTQILPFSDDAVIATAEEFERAVYANLASAGRKSKKQE